MAVSNYQQMNDKIKSLEFSHQQPKHILRKLMSYREKLLTLYMKYHGMPMPIYFSCFLSLMLLMTEEKPILLSVLSHFS